MSSQTDPDIWSPCKANWVVSGNHRAAPDAFRETSTAKETQPSNGRPFRIKVFISNSVYWTRYQLVATATDGRCKHRSNFHRTASGTLLQPGSHSVEAQLAFWLVAGGAAFSPAGGFVVIQPFVVDRQGCLSDLTRAGAVGPVRWTDGGEAGEAAGATLPTGEADGDQRPGFRYLIRLVTPSACM